MRFIIPGIDEIIELNKNIGGSVLNRGILEFLITKIESKSSDKNPEMQVAKIAAILWLDIIQLHPFLDGNKRTATEAVLLFLDKNKYSLETPVSGKVYISLKLANNEMKYEDLVKWLHQKIRKPKY